MTTSTETSEALTKPVPWYAYPFEAWNQIILRIAGRVGGAKGKEVERFLKFATVGILGAIIDFGVLNLLQTTVLSPEDPNKSAKIAVATGAAFISAVTSNFVWNRYWTYPDSRSRSISRQLVQFFLVSLAGLAFRLSWVRLMYGPFGGVGVDVFTGLGAGSFSETAEARLGTNIAQFFSVWIVMVWNFFVNRYWTYNDVE